MIEHKLKMTCDVCEIVIFEHKHMYRCQEAVPVFNDTLRPLKHYHTCAECSGKINEFLTKELAPEMSLKREQERKDAKTPSNT